MSVSCIKGIVLILLAVVVSAGPALSIAQASQMDATMHMTDIADVEPDGSCQDVPCECAGLIASDCTSTCTTSLSALTSGTYTFPYTDSREIVVLTAATPVDAAFLIEPKPPRPSLTF
jgi:hypothetical protein